MWNMEKVKYDTTTPVGGSNIQNVQKNNRYFNYSYSMWVIPLIRVDLRAE